ncbi:MAG: methyltransferase domain-containing protein [Nitrospinae bacterium]|nr:methyltransferase domain-containing protein [Nitrospinota bacterium]MBL7020943.1 methyltransferase domain-containing protein [Nitrospinaceae bacterium]
MSLKDKEKWNNKYESGEYITGKEPSAWLQANAHLLAKSGKALDIAGGEGRNSVFAASKGYEVTCLDIAENGLRKAQALAQEKNAKITTVLADLDSKSLKTNEYDLVLCFNFLDRSLFSGIRQTLKSGGLLFYETFTLDYLKYSNFKKEWVLEANELLQEFSDFRILRYQEVDENSKAFASMVAQKP